MVGNKCKLARIKVSQGGLSASSLERHRGGIFTSSAVKSLFHLIAHVLEGPKGSFEK